ncbi:MAG: response regulator, partial [Deltaproteobacteria bacterium]|nr:response regulator [Deltaproteobacteria bacterium]
LGLAICKHLTELMGGTLEAESQLDQGSRFSLTLAIGAPDRETRSEPVAPQRSPAPRFACRVLVAEDSPDNQRVVRHLLELAGAEVEVVENGQLAVERALSARDEQQAFDLILMDMQMPVLDGYDATRLLRQRDYTGAIVALTAHAMQGERERCLEAGCDAYETKPIPRARLTDLLRRFVAGAKSDSLD